MREKNDDCILQFECKPSGNNNYWFDCYYDPNDTRCHCYEGSRDKCRMNELNRIKQERKTSWDKFKERAYLWTKNTKKNISSCWNCTLSFIINNKAKVITTLSVLLIILILLYIKEESKSNYIEIVVKDKKSKKNKK